MGNNQSTGLFCSHCDSRRVHGTYCRVHSRLINNLSQKKRRQYKRQLGMCSDCTLPIAPGLSRCEKHQAEHLIVAARRDAKQMKKRGWKMVKVRI